uniref:Homeobox domain-containing protein n=1 Tax=Canis lupus familiaris TaxID=9615 RepID=A0A8C0TSY2_CANLF
MSPSPPLPSGRGPSSFGSVDWLSQSSRGGPSPPSRPAEAPRGGPSAPARGCSSGEPLHGAGVEEAKSSEACAPRTPTAGWGRDGDSLQVPRVRTAFTAEQLSTLESAFRRRRYLGPLERRRLARDMRLSEVQIKTWFQNRRMKHKRQLQDSQLSGPFPGGLHPPVTFCPPPPALRRPLRLLCPWAPPLGPPALGQPPGPFWDLCRVDRASVALAWASCSRQPPTCCLPDPGGQELGPALALSGVPRGLCALPQTGDAF